MVAAARALETIDEVMPTICRFLGIIVTMYYNDHAPPHFHARCGRAEALIAIDPLAALESTLPPRVLGLVLEWANEHVDELRSNWERARQDLPLRSVAPLA
jgi:Domain of unknown function (DUF4160)